jgi:hypothetical protein
MATCTCGSRSKILPDGGRCVTVHRPAIECSSCQTIVVKAHVEDVIVRPIECPVHGLLEQEIRTVGRLTKRYIARERVVVKAVATKRLARFRNRF